ncbi:hypothetical protein SAY86_028653 [Trapa natans]|uniref:Transcription factor MYC/MYB N-terminal domain-containing protein n=1 Tax=Trapa natans TaxID=22666 RepID=A0AAN7MD95_TRANT|nr:hypothetical protein SAY86_028653 [Trapa natans]
MVGSGGTDRSKEAVGMMALHEALRGVCLNSDWTYSVFWTIRPRPRIRGGNGCKVGDDNGSLMLMWEDGFCRGRVADCLEEIDGGEDPVRKAFSKMSIQLYNYGEGLMGKVASDKCHKWVFKEPSECEANISNYWQSSFDALPLEWTDQFESGIQTIAVIQAGHGLLQLGSCKIIPEDLHFVLRMRHTFESLGYQSGFYLSQLFSSNRNTSSSSIPTKTPAIPTRPPPVGLFNWGQRPLSGPPSSMLSTPNFQNRLAFPQSKEEPHMFILPHQHSNETGQMEEMMREQQENDIKWPNGLSFFNALTGRAEEAKLLFNPEGIGNKSDHYQNSQHHPQHPLFLDGKSLNDVGPVNPNEFLSLDSHSHSARKMDGKFKRSFTLPARMANSSSSASVDQQPVDYSRGSEPGIHSDMEPFIE